MNTIPHCRHMPSRLTSDSANAADRNRVRSRLKQVGDGLGRDWGRRWERFGPRIAAPEHAVAAGALVGADLRSVEGITLGVWSAVRRLTAANSCQVRSPWMSCRRRAFLVSGAIAHQHDRGVVSGVR